MASLLVGDHRVLSVDRPGYGRSGGPAMGLDEQALLFAALLDRRQLDHAVVLGHSLGGAIALLMAAQRPDQVDGLVLAASVGGDGSIVAADRLLAAPILGPLLSAVALAAYGLLGPVAASCAVPGVSSGDVPSAATTAPLASLSSFVGEQRSLLALAPEITAAIASVCFPVEVLHGSDDHVIALSAGADLADRLDGARLTELEGAGHLLGRDRPDELAAALREVIRRRDRLH